MRPSSVSALGRVDAQANEIKGLQHELEATKKVKVLYFLKEGRPVHWAEVSDYHPSEDFWNINHRDAVQKVRHLELIQTPPD